MLDYANASRLPLIKSNVSDLDEVVSKIADDFNKRTTLDDTINVIITATEVDDKLGNIYQLLLSDEVTLPPVTISYLQDLLLALSTGSDMDDVFLTDRLMMMTSCSASSLVKPSWTPVEKVTLDKLKHLPAIKVIKFFVNGPGLSKYFELLRLRTLGEG